MKYSVEMTPPEYAATLEVVKEVLRMTKLDKEMSKLRRRVEELERKRTMPSRLFGSDEDSDDDDDSDIFSDEDSESLDEVAPPIPFTEVIEGGKKPKKIDGKKALKGKKALAELVELWVINFDQEGALQPDRAEAVRELASTFKGPAICEYLRSVESLTLAVQECWPRDESGGQPLMRKIAENMAQVTSILFPPIADYIKYPNPLEE